MRSSASEESGRLAPFPDSLDAKICLRLIVWMRMNKVPLKSSQRVAIEAFLKHTTLSRSDLAEVTGLSLAAITEVTQDMLHFGLLKEFSGFQDKQRRARPSILRI